MDSYFSQALKLNGMSSTTALVIWVMVIFLLVLIVGIGFGFKRLNGNQEKLSKISEKSNSKGF